MEDDMDLHVDQFKGRHVFVAGGSSGINWNKHRKSA